jgi:hypothetical protein
MWLRKHPMSKDEENPYGPDDEDDDEDWDDEDDDLDDEEDDKEDDKDFDDGLEVEDDE